MSLSVCSVREVRSGFGILDGTPSSPERKPEARICEVSQIVDPHDELKTFTFVVNCLSAFGTSHTVPSRRSIEPTGCSR